MGARESADLRQFVRGRRVSGYLKDYSLCIQPVAQEASVRSKVAWPFSGVVAVDLVLSSRASTDTSGRPLVLQATVPGLCPHCVLAYLLLLVVDVVVTGVHTSGLPGSLDCREHEPLAESFFRGGQRQRVPLGVSITMLGYFKRCRHRPSLALRIAHAGSAR